MDNRQVIINSITNLVDAKINYNNSQPAFSINYEQTGSAPDVGYIIYRYIGDYPPDVSIDPITQSYNFKQIAITTPTLSQTYEDSLDDLEVHGFNKDVNGKYFDSNGNDVIEQIFTTKRAIYYRICAINNQGISFNATPFIFIGYNNGSLQCRSTVTQVIYNKLVEEGDVFWTYSGSGTVNAIAVDLDFSRTPSVWAVFNSGSTSIVKRISIATGTEINSYSLPFNVYGIRIDTSTTYGGDAIVCGRVNGLVRLTKDSNNAYQIFGSSSLSLGTYGGFALTLRSDPSDRDLLTAYVDWDRKYVTEWNITNPGIATLWPVDNYGGYVSNQFNVNGICTGSDGSIFCNGRRQTRIVYDELRTVTTTTRPPPCPGGDFWNARIQSCEHCV